MFVFVIVDWDRGQEYVMSMDMSHHSFYLTTNFGVSFMKHIWNMDSVQFVLISKRTKISLFSEHDFCKKWVINLH